MGSMLQLGLRREVPFGFCPGKHQEAAAPVRYSWPKPELFQGFVFDALSRTHVFSFESKKADRMQQTWSCDPEKEMGQ
jgi:hypothetical protein